MASTQLRTGNKMISAKLGTMPIGKLIFSMSGPAILSMLVQALYNIVDSVFIGMYDATNGVLALSYALPMQLLVNAFAIGFAVGTGSVIARKLGEGDRESAGNAAQTGIFLALMSGLLFLIVGYFVSEAFINAYTSSAAAGASSDVADWARVSEMGGVYLTICTCSSVGMMVEIMLNRILQSMGNMVIPMVTQIVGAVVNIALDPVFILDWGAGMGAAGAAVATVIGQVAAMIIPIIVIAKGKWDIQIFFKHFRLKWNILKQIIRVGLPSIVLNAIGSVMYMAANLILNTFANAVWSFGIYFKLQSFVFMPVFGLNQGCMPIMGYNYGANNRKRFDQTYFKAMAFAIVYMTLGMAIFHLFPNFLAGVFSPDTPEKLAAGVEALRICSTPFMTAAVSVIMIAMFNSVGQGVKAMSISLLRQIGLLLPIGYVLSQYTSLGATGVWIAFPIAEVVTTLIFFPISLATINKIFRIKHDEELSRRPFSDEEWLLYNDSIAPRHRREPSPQIDWNEMA